MEEDESPSPSPIGIYVDEMMVEVEQSLHNTLAACSDDADITLGVLDFYREAVILRERMRSHYE